MTRRDSVYILVDIRRGGSIVDRYEASGSDPQPAESARRYFESFTRGYKSEHYRTFVMLGNEPDWDID